MFFPSKEVVNVKFDELKMGDIVSFVIAADPRDPSKWQAQQVRKVVETGTIESLKNGFGFITNARNEKLFFHGRHLQGSSFEELKEGDQLEYRAVESRSSRGSGFEAQEIKLLPQA
jgi:cold shock CspA family protein